MYSSKWQKRNFYYQSMGSTITVVSAILVFLILNSFGQVRLGGLVCLLVLLGGFMVTVTLRNRNPNELLRILKTEYKATEIALGKAFEEAQIRFSQQLDDDGFCQFKFPENSLEMHIYPYDPIYGQQGFPGKETSVIKTPLSATAVLIQGVNSKNQEFAGSLTRSIEHMEIQKTRNRSSQ